jgi:hypothetical protein
MIFVSLYTMTPNHRNSAENRFKQTGGKPPAGIKVIGRWHSVSGGRGVTVCEASDAQAVAQWAHDWNDVIHFDIYPAIDDAGLAKLLG